MAEKITLEATRRELTGKQVKQLRSEGKIPAVLYGPSIGSMPLLVDWIELRPKLLKAGGSQVIKLNVEGDQYDVLVRSVQRRPVRGDVLHLDFYHVRMDVAIRTEVPVVLVGESEVLETAGGTYNQEKNLILIECLPGDLPASIEVSVEGLQAIGDMITVADLPQIEGVTYHADPDEIVVTTAYLEAPQTEEELEEEEEAREAEPELIRRREEEEEDED